MTETGGLSIAKATTTTSVSSVGDSIPYTYTVTNTSNVTLTNVGVTDLPVSPATATTPVCVNLTNPSAASCTTSSSTTLLPGQVAHFTASYSVTQADLNNGSVKDTASATGTNPPNIGGTVTGTSTQVTVPVTETGGLSIAKATTTSSVSQRG